MNHAIAITRSRAQMVLPPLAFNLGGHPARVNVRTMQDTRAKPVSTSRVVLRARPLPYIASPSAVNVIEYGDASGDVCVAIAETECEYEISFRGPQQHPHELAKIPSLPFSRH